MCMRKDTIIKKLDKLTELQKQIDELSYEVESIKTEMKEEMDKRGVEELVVGPYTVSYKSIVSARVDTKRLKEENPQVYKAFLDESCSRRFTVK